MHRLSQAPDTSLVIKSYGAGLSTWEVFPAWEVEEESSYRIVVVDIVCGQGANLGSPDLTTMETQCLHGELCLTGREGTARSRSVHRRGGEFCTVR